MVHKGSDVSIDTQPEEEECTGIILKNIWTIRCLDNKGIMISKTKDQKHTLWSRMDKLDIPEAQVTTNSLVENQLMFKMTSEPER